MNKPYKASSKINLLRYPKAALKYWQGDRADFHRALIIQAAAELLKEDFEPEVWNKALNEIDQTDIIPMKPINQHVGNDIRTLFGKWLYASIRAVKPEKIIETGISHGISSWVILNALSKNGTGKLFSIDLPNLDSNENYNFKQSIQTGEVVPVILRSNWKMIVGDAKKELPKLLNELGQVDYFFHDSDHSYKHMLFEFETVYPYLKKGGIIASDDINKNTSFQDFSRMKEIQAITFTKGGCAIK